MVDAPRDGIVRITADGFFGTCRKRGAVPLAVRPDRHVFADDGVFLPVENVEPCPMQMEQNGGGVKRLIAACGEALDVLSERFFRLSLNQFSSGHLRVDVDL